MNLNYVWIVLGIILAVLLLYLGFTHLIKNKDFKGALTSSIDIQTLIQALGGVENIVSTRSSSSKLTVEVRSHDVIDISSIQGLGASGIVEGRQTLTMIFGKQSPMIENDLKRFL